MTNHTHLPNSEPPPAPSRTEGEEQGNKHAALTVAVIVATLFIVGAWLLFLPYQLRQSSSNGTDEAARWQEVREDVNVDTTSFREALDSLRGNYESLEERVNLQEGSNTEDTGTGRVPPEVIERLRNKLSELQEDADSGEDGDAVSAADETDSDTYSEETHASTQETE